jgi:ATP-dependent RNA helicase DHX37/DHR1
MSGKKQKRLDKYIETKLRKDENVRLIKRLEGRESDVDLKGFVSARRLGQRVESKRDEIRRAEVEKRRGIESTNVENSEESEEGEEVEIPKPLAAAVVRHSSALPAAPKAPQLGLHENVSVVAPLYTPVPKTAFGSGLKRPLEIDEDGRPIIKTRVRSKGKGVRIELLPAQPQESEWTGFSDLSEMPTESEGDEDNSESAFASSEEDDSEAEEGEESESESEEEDEGEEEQEDEASKTAKKERRSAFTAWAEQQRNETLGFTPSTVIGSISSSGPLSAAQQQAAKSFVPREPEQDPLPEALLLDSGAAIDRKAHVCIFTVFSQ